MAKMTVDFDRCKGCGMCESVCPQKIIVHDLAVINQKGYNPAIVNDEAKCTGCAMCATMCPDCAIIVER